jgi:hypothetical protein
MNRYGVSGLVSVGFLDEGWAPVLSTFWVATILYAWYF